MRRRQWCGGAGRVLCSCLPLAGSCRLSCHPCKLHMEFLVCFPCLKAKTEPALAERTDEMGSDSHSSGAAGRIDLEQC